MTDIANFPSDLLDESPAREIDLAAATSAAESFLLALGVSCDSESMTKSPRRMAEAYAALLTARPFEMTTCPNEERYDELVIVRSIPVQSVCEHHFLPFTGVAHVAYLPDYRVVGLSKLARVVEMFGRRSGPRTTHPADRELPRCAPVAQGCRCRDRSRAQLHDTTRRPRRRHHDQHLGAQGHTARPAAIKGRVLRLPPHRSMMRTRNRSRSQS